PFRVSVEFNDGEGSGVSKVELTYKIGTGIYKDYRIMNRESNNTWYYEISETGGWDRYRGQTLYYKARATDMVGNVSPETPEQQELIDDINDPPTVQITTTYKDWEKGSILIQATASDQDGEVKTVQFQYSLDNVNWINIGDPLTKTPYSVTWNTAEIELADKVWLKAIATDNDNATSEAPIAKSFGIDNKPPDFANWQLTPPDLKESSTDLSLKVEVEITDQGSGVDETSVQIKYKIAQGVYSDYLTMYKNAGNRWYREIPKPTGNWSIYAGEKVYYKVKVQDKAGNIIETEERTELIDPTTGVISGNVNPREAWRVARVAVQLNAQTVTEVAVSQIDGSYSIKGLNPGSYNLIISAIGFGTDKSQSNIEVKVGQVTPVPTVELYTYSVETIGRSQGGKVDFRDADSKDYSVTIEGNTFIKDTKVVLGFSGLEPTSVPNPTVKLLGKAIGVGFEGKEIFKALKFTLPRPSGITDPKSVMLFIYNGVDYRMISRNDIATNDATITAYVIPPDVQNFSDSNHKFDRVLSRTTDTVFYILITKFEEPQLNTNDLGIRDPVLSFGKITGYVQPVITSASRKIALVVHGITSKTGDMVNIITDLKLLTPT
ncbi:MAG: carboxypeptidase-like regulatory domain-containing protein, partial [Candidatus Poribacteria bacterium]